MKKYKGSILVSDLAQMLNIKESTILSKLKLHNLEPDYHYGKAYISTQSTRLFLSEKGYNYRSQVISFQMLKGGVAKTTTCLNVGLRAHMYGAKVLFVDLDQQANLTYACGIDDLELPVLVDVIEGRKTTGEIIKNIAPGLDILPSSLNNSVLEKVLLTSYRNIKTVMKNVLREVRNQYDYIFIDTAPALSLLNTSVTCVSDVVILPVTPDKFTLFGLQKHLIDLKNLKSEFELSFSEKILFTKFDNRESASQDYLEQCIQKFKDQLMSNYIRNNSDVKTLIGIEKNIFEQKGYGKEDYDMVTREIMNLWQ